jgi:hypothetical protein
MSCQVTDHMDARFTSTVAQKNGRLRKLLSIYDAVMLAGKRSEMFESSYVAFLEDIRLPKEREQLREFWQHAPKIFAKEIKHDRELR